MPARFSVLASGSAGNASLLQSDGFGLLIDAGMGPRKIATRLAAAGARWSSVNAVLLTHTHGDHWNHRTLAHLRRERIPFYCHVTHADALTVYSKEMARLQRERLVRTYQDADSLQFIPGLRCRPLRIRHDGGATFGFRLEGIDWAIAYVADLGSWTPNLAAELADVDVLCLEFNHDVEMERTSGRTPELIARILGDDGHLSNDQAANLLEYVLRLSRPGRLRHVVQLHLSRQCNFPDLAVTSARTVLNGDAATIRIHTAHQDQAGPVIAIDSVMKSRARPSPTCVPQWLPGWES